MTDRINIQTIIGEELITTSQDWGRQINLSVKCESIQIAHFYFKFLQMIISVQAMKVSGLHQLAQKKQNFTKAR